ncbi:BTAD domain-containing putative transcriptional regulator [Micromonospora sp. BQ11]|uniref:BTAD domain-containing putative transcriptional regulator n=1 Tax=Micromonospora sp. BQ11 TaxID=3452212 RepID=UPI003F8A02C3
MLGYLALHHPRAASAERLMEVVWPGVPAERARHSLHQRIHELRKRLVREPTGADPGQEIDLRWDSASAGYRLVLPPGRLDADTFGSLLSTARAHATRADLPAAVSTLGRAIRLWRGPVLDGIPALQDLAEVCVLEEQRRVAQELMWEWSLRLGHHPEIVAELEAAARAEPLRERTQGLLLLALRRCGRHAEALASYARFRAVVRDELGTEPGTWLRGIHQALLENGDEPGRLAGAAPPRTVGASSFVGRQSELALLTGTVRRVVDGGAGHLVTVVGEPGIGKSRLVKELLGGLPAGVEAVWTARCRPEPPPSAFAPLAEMFAAESGILVSDAAQEATAKASRFLAGSRGIGSSSLLTAALDIGDESNRVDGSDVRHAWLQILRATAERPAVLVVEDIHWARSELLDFLEDLVFVIGDRPLLLLCTSRPDLVTVRPTWAAGSANATSMTLAGLDESAARQIVSPLLSVASEEAVVRVLRQAAGNPLFLEQLARTIDRDGDDGTALPSALEDVISNRWATLSGTEATVLRAAAILGDTVWTGAVQAVVESIEPGSCDVSRLQRAMRLLCRLGFLRRSWHSTITGEEQFTFTHAALRRVGYLALDDLVRAAGHHAAARWWDALPHGRGVTLGEIAHHFEQAVRACGDQMDDLLRRQATEAIRAAGVFALAHGDHAAAMQRLRCAATLVPESSPERARVLLDLGESLYHHGVGGDAVLREACDLLVRLGDLAAAAKAELVLGWLAWARGDGRAALRQIRHAVRQTMAQPASASTLRILSVGSALLAIGGDIPLATSAAALAYEQHDQGADPQPSVLAHRGIVGIQMGERRALQDLQDAEALARRHDLAVPLSFTFNAISYHWVFGDLLAAQHLLRDTVGVAGDRRTDSDDAWLAALRLMHRYWAGDLTELRDELIAFAPRGHQLDSDLLRVRALLHARCGDHAAAVADCDAAVEAAERGGAIIKIFSAHCCRLSIRPELATDPVGELLALPRPFVHPAEAGIHLARVLKRSGDSTALNRFGFVSTPWVQAAAAYLDDRQEQARSHYLAIGSTPDADFAARPAVVALAGRFAG